MSNKDLGIKRAPSSFALFVQSRTQLKVTDGQTRCRSKRPMQRQRISDMKEMWRLYGNS